MFLFESPEPEPEPEPQPEPEPEPEPELLDWSSDSSVASSDEDFHSAIDSEEGDSEWHSAGEDADDASSPGWRTVEEDEERASPTPRNYRITFGHFFGRFAHKSRVVLRGFGDICAERSGQLYGKSQWSQRRRSRSQRRRSRSRSRARAGLWRTSR